MTYEEAIRTILPGRYRHFKGNEYEVSGISKHSETEEPMVVYRALYGDGGLWCRPASVWLEEVVRDGKIYQRFEKIVREQTAIETEEVFPKDFLNEYTTLSFEGVEVRAMARYHEYLTHYYGDYMTRPKKNKQKSHHGFVAYYV